MAILTLFYSRTGTTRKVAEAISQDLSCDVEEVFDTKNRSGPLGFLSAVRDASKRRLTTLQNTEMHPEDYDIIVLGTPVWAGTMAVPIRTYISQNREHFSKVALFCTYGGTGAETTLEDMKNLCNKSTVASMAIRTKETRTEEYRSKIEQFVDAMKGPIGS